jgi:hypothetical protein
MKLHISSDDADGTARPPPRPRPATITVKHVTTNNVTADQAIIAESVTTSGGRDVSPALLNAGSESPMPLLDGTRLPDPVGVGGGTKKK